MLHDPDAGHTTKPPKSGCRRAVGCFGSVFLLLLALLFLPPQISRVMAGDLRPAPQRELADEANGWVATIAVVERLQSSTPMDYQIGELGASSRAWVAQNAVLLPEFDHALALPDAICPWETAFIDDGFKKHAALRDGYRFGTAAAAVDAEAGRAAEAAGRLLGMVRLSRGVVTNDSPTIAALVGLACEAITLRAIQRIVSRHAIVPHEADWEPLRQALLQGPSAGEMVASTQRGEYRYFYLITLAPDELPAGTNPAMLDLYRKQRLIPASSLNDPYRTVARFRATSEAISAEAARPRPQRDQALLDAVASGGAAGGMPGYNPAGEAVLRMVLTTSPKLLDRADRTVADRRLTATLLALRIHDDRTGKLPATLDELVPAGLLDAVPIDPFDEQPLRYDPSRKLLWSIGENEQDDGGQERSTTKPVKRLDIVVPVEFGAK